jgi:two-component system response regulator RegA
MTMNNSAILLIDDDEIFCQVMQRSLARRNITADYFTSSQAAMLAMQTQAYARAIVDLKIAQDSGLSVIKALKELNPDIRIIMLTGYASIATAVEAIKLGALNYLCKPVEMAEILSAFENTQLSVSITPEHPPSLERMEWEHIQKTLQSHNGNISATARELGMHRRTLQRKLLKRPNNSAAFK